MSRLFFMSFMSVAVALRHDGVLSATREAQQSQELANPIVWMNPGLTSPIPGAIASII